MNIATNLALTDEEVDHLLLAGSHLLRNSPEFQRLLRELAKDIAATSSPSDWSQQSSPPR